MLNLLRRRPTITLDHINIVQAVAGQVALSTESIGALHQDERLQLAEEQAISVLEDIGLVIPDNLIHIAVAAAIYSVNQAKRR